MKFFKKNGKPMPGIFTSLARDAKAGKMDRREFLAMASAFGASAAGAYGMSMSSNYNTRPRAAEILIVGSQTHVIRQRESIEQIIAGEQIIAY